MNTPTHGVLNLAILGRRAHPEWNSPIVFGAILPDAPIVALWLVATFVWREPQHQIWSETYFRPGWQIAVDLPHSFPLLAVALAGLAVLRLRRAQMFLASMLLHACGDVFLHGADAHRHFFPLSNYRFVSTVSYWDPAHYGNVVFPVEVLFVLLASVFAWRLARTSAGRGLLIAVDLVYLAAAAALTYVRFSS